MDIRELWLKQKEAVRAKTRPVLAAIPAGKFGYTPGNEALSIGEMLRHLWMSEEGVRRVALEADFAYYEKRIPQGLRAVLGAPRTLEEELADLERVHAESLAAVAAFPLERFEEMRDHDGLGYHRRVYAVLFGIIEHEAHHRAQLMLCLRLLGSPLPEPSFHPRR